MSKYEKIANWIMSECDSPISEIEWLLEQIYNPKESRVEIDFDKVICPKIEDDYDAVLTYISEKDDEHNTGVIKLDDEYHAKAKINLEKVEKALEKGE